MFQLCDRLGEGSSENLPSPRRSHNTNYWYSWVQTSYYAINVLLGFYCPFFNLIVFALQKELQMHKMYK